MVQEMDQQRSWKTTIINDNRRVRRHTIREHHDDELQRLPKRGEVNDGQKTSRADNPSEGFLPGLLKTLSGQENPAWNNHHWNNPSWKEERKQTRVEWWEKKIKTTEDKQVPINHNAREGRARADQTPTLLINRCSECLFADAWELCCSCFSAARSFWFCSVFRCTSGYTLAVWAIELFDFQFVRRHWFHQHSFIVIIFTCKGSRCNGQ